MRLIQASVTTVSAIQSAAIRDCIRPIETKDCICCQPVFCSLADTYAAAAVLSDKALINNSEMSKV
jgi:hypothetical protein